MTRRPHELHHGSDAPEAAVRVGALTDAETSLSVITIGVVIFGTVGLALGYFVGRALVSLSPEINEDLSRLIIGSASAAGLVLGVELVAGPKRSL